MATTTITVTKKRAKKAEPEVDPSLILTTKRVRKPASNTPLVLPYDSDDSDEDYRPGDALSDCDPEPQEEEVPEEFEEDSENESEEDAPPKKKSTSTASAAASGSSKKKFNNGPGTVVLNQGNIRIERQTMLF